MAKVSRHVPARLGEKLTLIRKRLEVATYEDMIKRLRCAEVSLYRSAICEYEQNKREPPLIVLLNYARLANIPMEMLVDDSLELPECLPVKRRRRRN
ncbi:MAG: hypothetical protein WA584_06020 [Pyrinomonadaceae bacterium]